MSKSDNWKAFYTEERSFFEYLNKHTKVLYEIGGCEPCYNEVLNEFGKLELVAPSYVRSLRTHTGNLSEILAKADLVKQSYALAKAEDLGVSINEVQQHHRALQYVKNIDSATLSITSAHRSVVVKRKNKDEVVVYRNALQKSRTQSDLALNKVKSLCEKLKKSGLKSATVNVVGSKKRSAQITLSQRDLLTYFDAKDLTVRELSGKQYIADLSYHSQDLPITRTNFGLLLTDNANAEMLIARPRKKRSNALEVVAEQVFLPIQTSYEFFKKH